MAKASLLITSKKGKVMKIQLSIYNYRTKQKNIRFICEDEFAFSRQEQLRRETLNEAFTIVLTELIDK